MHRTRTLIRAAAGCVAALGLMIGTDVSLEATPSGVTFTVLSRARVPEFDATRWFRLPDEESAADGQHKHRWKPPKRRLWKIEMEATREIDVVTVLFTVQPGGHSGWHTHPGPAIFTVSKGTLTMYEGDDPTCTPLPFPAGTGSLEAGSTSHRHLLRNETTEVAETIVTFLVPVGAPIRTDLPDPGTCSF